MRPFDPGRPDPRLHVLLEDYPVDLFSQSFHEACRWTDRYAEEWALEISRQLQLQGLRPSTPEEACAAFEFEPKFARALGWLLAMLETQGLARATLTEGRRLISVATTLPEASLAETRQCGLAAHPELAPTFDIFDAAGGIYVDVARGRKQGDSALFGLGQAGLWIRYFDNANPVYAVNNRVAALHAARFLTSLPPPWRVLELGAGAGSASEALLAALQATQSLGSLASYDVTEPSSFFRRQAERRLSTGFPRSPLRFRGLDMNAAWAEQGFGEEGWDLIYGVNVLHVARNLGATLERVRRHLSSRGHLIAGEAMRLATHLPLASELIFSILDGFTQVDLDAELRPEPGFLAPDSWRRSLRAAGFTACKIEPDLDSIAPLFPRFGVGVMISGKATDRLSTPEE